MDLEKLRNHQLVVFCNFWIRGMSGAQPKAGTIAGCVTVCAEVNPKITKIRHEQGWIQGNNRRP